MNITKATFGTDRTSTENSARTAPLWQYDYGQILQMEGIELPQAYEVHFSNTKHGTSVTMLGDENGVAIPDALLLKGESVYAWVYLHTGNSDGETEYVVTIPVNKRAKPTNDTPTPVQQDIIEQTIAALENALEECESAVEHYPKIVEGHWYVWDAELGDFVDTGIDARGLKGDTGTVFIPDVSVNGVISWTNDGGLPNPDPVDITHAVHLDEYARLEDLATKLDAIEKGTAGGVAELDEGGKVPSSQLPAYVDDVLEFASVSQFPAVGEAGKIYVSTSNNTTYRWSGSQYVGIGGSLALGETSSTAYRGDRGRFAYEHALNKGGAFSLGLYKVQTNEEGHVTAVQAVTGSDIPGLNNKADKTDTLLYTTLSRGRKANTTVGTASFAFGDNVTASGTYSHAEGTNTTASGGVSHAEGVITTASGGGSHSEGNTTQATGNYAHAEGSGTTASGEGSHAEGGAARATAYYSHAEGSNTQATANYAHAEGSGTTASGGYAHAEGGGTTASGLGAHTEGGGTIATGTGAHAEGTATGANGHYSHAEGDSTHTYGNASHTEGYYTETHEIARGAHAEGDHTHANAMSSHAEGAYTVASSDSAHAEGNATIASGSHAHAEGAETTASGINSHAEGASTTASGNGSHAEGSGTTASGSASHAEGAGTTAANANDHAEGAGTIARGVNSHAEGAATTASGGQSHAEGASTMAIGPQSHAEGTGTKAVGFSSHAAGAYNIADSYDNWPEWTADTQYAVGDKVKRTTMSGNDTVVRGYVCKTANSDSNFTSGHWNDDYGRMNFIEIIGNGSDDTHRSNVRAMDWDGNAYFMGDVYVGCNPDSTGGTKLTPGGGSYDVATIAETQAIIDEYGVSA